MDLAAFYTELTLQSNNRNKFAHFKTAVGCLTVVISKASPLSQVQARIQLITLLLRYSNNINQIEQEISCAVIVDIFKKKIKTCKRAHFNRELLIVYGLQAELLEKQQLSSKALLKQAFNDALAYFILF